MRARDAALTVWRKQISMPDWFTRCATGGAAPQRAQLRSWMNAASSCFPARSHRSEWIYWPTLILPHSRRPAIDMRVGSTSTKVVDFVNRGTDWGDIYVFPPLLEACCRVIGRPFKLSSFLGRTLRPHTAAQELHVDVRRESPDWPLLGFILMIDEFRPDNGATRFVPGSHRWSSNPEDAIPDPRSKHHDQVFACGPPGSLIVFNGSTWHGHSENTSNGPRRSLQGAFVPRSRTCRD